MPGMTLLTEKLFYNALSFNILGPGNRLKNALYVIALLTLAACSDKPDTEKTTHSPRADSDRAILGQTIAGTTRTDTGLVRADGSTPNAPARVADADAWAYKKTVDKNGDVVHKASINSPTILTFGFPYNGPSTATLTIRKRSQTLAVYAEVSRGNFNQSFQGGTAKIRFDAKPPVAYAFSAAANGRGNIIFFDDGQKLVDRMKTARQMVIEVGFDNQGQRQITFNTAGLRWNH